MSNEQEQKDISLERINRCVPVAKEILNLIATADIPIGNITEEEFNKYDPLAKQILVLMLEKDVNYSDRDIIFQLVMQAVEMAKGKVIANLETSYNKAMSKLWNGKDYMEITMSQIDLVLRGGGTA